MAAAALPKDDEEDPVAGGRGRIPSLDPDDVAFADDALPDEGPGIDGGDGRPPDGFRVVGETAPPPAWSSIMQTTIDRYTGLRQSAIFPIDTSGGVSYDGLHEKTQASREDDHEP